MEYGIVRGEAARRAFGCDVAVQLADERENGEIRVLQLTDMQVIDSAQSRTPDRLRADEIRAWAPDNFDVQCGDHVRSLVAQTRPDLIILTGDLVYGSFDDAGSTFEWFCELMDSFRIPWAPVFGNHDNESKRGVAWQCERFEKSPFCLFRRGEASGNGNYSVGIAVGRRLLRVIHMVDSNGCKGASDPEVIHEMGIFPDQLALIRSNTARIRDVQGRTPPAFMAFHIPTTAFREAERAKGYLTDGRDRYVLGVDTPALDGDFGFRLEAKTYPLVDVEGFVDFLHGEGIDGVFVGHFHATTTVIDYAGVKWVHGLKTGQYDYHVPGQLGGTLITLRGEAFTVLHVPSLVHYAPMPGGARIFDHFFVDERD